MQVLDCEIKVLDDKQVRCVHFRDQVDLITGKTLVDALRDINNPHHYAQVQRILNLTSQPHIRLFSRVVRLWPNASVHPFASRNNTLGANPSFQQISNLTQPFRLLAQPWVPVIIDIDVRTALSTQTDILVQALQPLYVEFVEAGMPMQRHIWTYVLPPLSLQAPLLCLTGQSNANSRITLWDGTLVSGAHLCVGVDQWLLAADTLLETKLASMVISSEPTRYVHIAHKRAASSDFKTWCSQVLGRSSRDLNVLLTSYARSLAQLWRTQTDDTERSNELIFDEHYRQQWHTDCATAQQRDERALAMYLTLVTAAQQRSVLFDTHFTFANFLEVFIAVANRTLRADLAQIENDIESLLLTLQHNNIAWSVVMQNETLLPQNGRDAILCDEQSRCLSTFANQLLQSTTTTNSTTTSTLVDKIVACLREARFTEVAVAKD